MDVAVEEHDPRLWGLDPVFSTHVKLNILDMKNLTTRKFFPGTDTNACLTQRACA